MRGIQYNDKSFMRVETREFIWGTYNENFFRVRDGNHKHTHACVMDYLL